MVRSSREPNVAGHGAQSGLEGGIVGGGALVLGASEGIEVGAVGLKVG